MRKRQPKFSITVSLTPELFAQLDQWRQGRDFATVTEAVRELVRRGVAAGEFTDQAAS